MGYNFSLMYRVFTIIATGILLCTLQQESAPQNGKSQKQAPQTTQAKSDNSPKGSTAGSRARTSDDQPKAVEHRENQNIRIVSSAPEKSVDLVERIIAIGGLLCTLALAYVGIRGIGIALKTLIEVRRQREEMGKQVEATSLQVRAMQEQITEMSVQSGILQESVKVARDAVKAAQDGATAAQTSAINDERAVRLTQRADVLISEFELRKDSSGKIIGRDTQFIIHFKNFGPTRASEVTTAFSAEIPEAKNTSGSRTIHNPPTAPIVYGAGDAKNVTFNRLCEMYDDKIIDKIADGSFSVHLFGAIKFRDVFGTRHTVRCGATWTSTLYTFVADITEIEEQPSEDENQKAT